MALTVRFYFEALRGGKPVLSKKKKYDTLSLVTLGVPPKTGAAMSQQFDKKKAAKTIRLVLDQIRTVADPRLLREYRALFKKEVSLFRRSWAAAYLFFLRDQGAGAGRAGKDRARGPGSPGGPPDKPGRAPGRGPRNRPDEGRRAGVSLAEKDSRLLFINAGRNRRVFPREILGLISAKTGVPKEDIGAIRILDNYSFIQVRDSAADSIIQALNGQSFRGKALAVSYARARKENGEDSAGKGRDGGELAPATDEPEASGDGEAAPAPDEPEASAGGEAAALPEQDEDHPDEKAVYADPRQ
jgi:hypothetical protein